MVEDLGEQFEGEKDGDDIRNEQSYKRPANTGLSPEAKKPKTASEASATSDDQTTPTEEPPSKPEEIGDEPMES